MATQTSPGVSAPRTQQRYHGVAQTLHWVMAAMIITNVFIGIFHDDWTDATKAWSMGLHKSLGMTVFMLVLVRLGWRLTNPPPPYDPPLVRWQKLLSKAVHWIFYALMVGLPIGGFLMSSGGSRPMLWFGIEIPKAPIDRESTLWEIAHEGHEIGGYIMAWLIGLHILAALYHWFAGMDDNVAERMFPNFVKD